MAERRLPGLQRVLGGNALFSTAYGSVWNDFLIAMPVGIIAYTCWAS